MSAVLSPAPVSMRPLRTVSVVAGRFLLRFGLLAVLCWVWQRATEAAANPYFPTPLQILDRMRTLWFAGPASHLWISAPLWTDVAPSLVRMLIGWLGGSLLGAVIGVSAGAFPTVRRMVDPAAQFLRALPTPAILPVFLIVFGANDVMRVLVIAFGCTWPVLLNAMQATGAIDPVARDTARTLRLGPVRRLVQVDLCYATPAILAGMRVGLSLALVLMVLSEWVVATSGLGFFLVDSQRHFEFAGMWAAMVALGVLGYVFNTVFTTLEHRALRWHRHSRARHD
ncbi:ABC transporter permease [Amycolatopsis sp. NPDC001319]|uniref:ABC transporter permease n=1 Tax=unclassified Amycolatopsis TaxID=2618356 RepID=UPI00369BB20E